MASSKPTCLRMWPAKNMRFFPPISVSMSVGELVEEAGRSSRFVTLGTRSSRRGAPTPVLISGHLRTGERLVARGTDPASADGCSQARSRFAYLTQGFDLASGWYPSRRPSPSCEPPDYLRRQVRPRRESGGGSGQPSIGPIKYEHPVAVHVRRIGPRDFPIHVTHMQDTAE
jgi:hypothetical protein